MPTFRPPDVAFRPAPTSRRIEASYGHFPAFLGGCAAGPWQSPTTVKDWADYCAQFGAGMHSPMNRAVYAYFLNTSAPVCVVRCADTAVEADDAMFEDYQRGLQATAEIAEVHSLVMPGITWKGAGKAIIETAMAQCQRRDDRLVIADLPAGLRLKSAAKARQLRLPVADHVVVYYPWARISNPDYSARSDQRVRRSLLASPAALAAAMWVETDRNRGVWKAPAGTHLTLAGVHRLQYAVDNATQDVLNPLGINCLRRMTGLGTVVWGARTRAGQTSRQWQYIPVKRSAQYIRSSIEKSTAWVIFEANDHNLWASLRASVDAFMQELFRQGAFQGSDQRDAWYVRCGLGETMTQSDVDRGRVIIEIGFAPLKPAEFVIIRVGKKAAT